MAKQAGIVQLQGTINGITFYKSGKVFLARAKSSLTKERFYNDPAFERSRQRAAMKKITAPLAAIVYRHLPKAKKKKGMFGKMVAEADRQMLAGHTQIEILGLLYLKFFPVG